MCFTVFLGVSVSMDIESWGKLYLLKCKRGRSLPPFFRQYAIERMSLFLRNLFLRVVDAEIFVLWSSRWLLQGNRVSNGIF